MYGEPATLPRGVRALLPLEGMSTLRKNPSNPWRIEAAHEQQRPKRPAAVTFDQLVHKSVYGVNHLTLARARFPCPYRAELECRLDPL